RGAAHQRQQHHARPRVAQLHSRGPAHAPGGTPLADLHLGVEREPLHPPLDRALLRLPARDRDVREHREAPAGGAGEPVLPLLLGRAGGVARRAPLRARVGAAAAAGPPLHQRVPRDRGRLPHRPDRAHRGGLAGVESRGARHRPLRRDPRPPRPGPVERRARLPPPPGRALRAPGRPRSRGHRPRRAAAVERVPGAGEPPGHRVEARGCAGGGRAGRSRREGGGDRRARRQPGRRGRDSRRGGCPARADAHRRGRAGDGAWRRGGRGGGPARVKIERWKLALAAVVTLGLLALSVPWGADLGWAFLADHQYARAERMFVEALRGEPSDGELWLGLAATYAALGDPVRQIGTLEQAIRTLPGRRDLKLQLADVYEANKEPAAAARVLEELTVTPRPDDGPLLDRLLTRYLWAADYERQLAVLRKLAALETTDRAVVTELAATARALNRQQEAVAVLESYVRRRPDDPEGRRWLAQVYDSLGQSPRAVEQWKVVARLLPADLEARDRLLPAPGGAAQSEELALLERRREAEPRDETVRQRLVALYRGMADGPRAIAAQRELVALRPRDPDALVTLGQLLVEQDRGRDAIPLYERALEMAPDRAETALTLAQLYEWNNDPRRALAVLDRLARARPEDRGLQERVAALARGTDDGAAALAALDRLAALRPEGPYAEQAV